MIILKISSSATQTRTPVVFTQYGKEREANGLLNAIPYSNLGVIQKMSYVLIGQGSLAAL
jgi:hypothetical protein